MRGSANIFAAAVFGTYTGRSVMVKPAQGEAFGPYTEAFAIAEVAPEYPGCDIYDADTGEVIYCNGQRIA